MSLTIEQELIEAVSQRRNFAIISHPDAGKTTLTEKLLPTFRIFQKNTITNIGTVLFNYVNLQYLNVGYNRTKFFSSR